MKRILTYFIFVVLICLNVLANELIVGSEHNGGQRKEFTMDPKNLDIHTASQDTLFNQSCMGLGERDFKGNRKDYWNQSPLDIAVRNEQQYSSDESPSALLESFTTKKSSPKLPKAVKTSDSEAIHVDIELIDKNKESGPKILQNIVLKARRPPPLMENAEKINLNEEGTFDVPLPTIEEESTVKPTDGTEGMDKNTVICKTLETMLGVMRRKTDVGILRLLDTASTTVLQLQMEKDQVSPD